MTALEQKSLGAHPTYPLAPPRPRGSQGNSLVWPHEKEKRPGDEFLATLFWSAPREGRAGKRERKDSDETVS